jgi:hypothetical protein
LYSKEAAESQKHDLQNKLNSEPHMQAKSDRDFAKTDNYDDDFDYDIEEELPEAEE